MVQPRAYKLPTFLATCQCSDIRLLGCGECKERKVENINAILHRGRIVLRNFLFTLCLVYMCVSVVMGSDMKTFFSVENGKHLGTPRVDIKSTLSGTDTGAILRED